MKKLVVLLLILFLSSCAIFRGARLDSNKRIYACTRNLLNQGVTADKAMEFCTDLFKYKEDSWAE